MSDTKVKLSGTYDSIEAYKILEEIQEMGANYNTIYQKSVDAEAKAEEVNEGSQTILNTLNTKIGEINTLASNVSANADSASASAANALANKDEAVNSANSASISEANAKASEDNAKTSEENALATANQFASDISGINTQLNSLEENKLDIPVAVEFVDNGLKVKQDGTENGGFLRIVEGGIRVIAGINGEGTLAENWSNINLNKGNITIQAKSETDSGALKLYPSSITYNDKAIERVNAYSTNYIRFESGLQIVFMLGSNMNMNSETTFTFPVPFISAPVVTVSATNGIGSGTYATSVYGINTNSCKMSVGGSSSANSYNPRIIAIGRWK